MRHKQDTHIQIPSYLIKNNSDKDNLDFVYLLTVISSKVLIQKQDWQLTCSCLLCLSLKIMGQECFAGGWGNLSAVIGLSVPFRFLIVHWVMLSCTAYDVSCPNQLFSFSKVKGCCRCFLDHRVRSRESELCRHGLKFHITFPKAFAIGGFS